MAYLSSAPKNRGLQRCGIGSIEKDPANERERVVGVVGPLVPLTPLGSNLREKCYEECCENCTGLFSVENAQNRLATIIYLLYEIGK